MLCTAIQTNTNISTCSTCCTRTAWWLCWNNFNLINAEKLREKHYAKVIADKTTRSSQFSLIGTEAKPKPAQFMPAQF